MKTAVEWLAEKYNYVTWMRNRDEISAGLADEWRKHYLDQAKEMEKEKITKAWKAGDGQHDKVADKLAKQYYEKTYGGNNE
jgi:hypothetical protein